ncbi:MaoC family dehydratase [Subtercola lobariae]|uniref:Molybdenum cofactor biosynthesis protein MoeC n=1 Tax=Subtercola lobariae TaxID=1588641 RepID=A0A917BGN2_9MICO|nr:MaoC family dehydratase [Subtercola lobariae]GGF42121.1 molybdenum cofactor biosynthesis protein MoeC [Subtercola lobariae]
MSDNDSLRVVPGWTGRFYEDFAVGDIYYHPMARTLTDADNQWFTLMTQNTSKTHLDANFALQTEYGRPLMNSTLTLALVTGQSTIDLSFNVFANLGWDEVRCPVPVFAGDTIYSRSTVISLRPSGSRPQIGIVTVATEGYNQDGVVVLGFRRAFMVYRRGEGPSTVGSRPDEASLLKLAGGGTASVA